MATSYNINTIQGDNLQITLSIKQKNNTLVNLSGYNVRGVVKYAYGYTGQDQVLLNLNPSIVSGLNGSSYASGLVNINVPSNISCNLPVGTFVYDIERFPLLNPTGNSIKLLRGKFIVEPETTAF